MMRDGFDRTPEEWRQIYSWWALMTYFWQAFGVAWILWGGGLTVWMFITQDTSRVTAVAMIILVLVLILPAYAMFFGAWRFRRWTRRQLTELPRSERRPPLNLP